VTVIILYQIFVGDQLIIQREMKGSDECEVSLKEMKDTVLILVERMMELKSAETGHSPPSLLFSGCISLQP